MSERKAGYNVGIEEHADRKAHPAKRSSKPEPGGPSSDQQHAPSLASLLSREEQQVLALKLNQVMSEGYGEVTITIKNGFVVFVETRQSHKIYRTET